MRINQGNARPLPSPRGAGSAPMEGHNVVNGTRDGNLRQRGLRRGGNVKIQGPLQTFGPRLRWVPRPEGWTLTGSEGKQF